jgi:GT2 family glycosyltransferase
MENHPDVGASGGKILNPEGNVEPFRSAKSFPTPLSKFFVDIHLDKIFPGIRFFGRYSLTGWDREDAREVDVLSGAFLFIRKETVENVGLLDERFFLLAEDLDWCRRIKQKDWKIMFNPEVAIIHHGGKSIDQVKLTRIKNEIYSHLLYFRKHHGGFAVLQYRWLAGFTNILKTKYWILRYILGKNRKLSSGNVRAYFRAIGYCFSFPSEWKRR